MASVSIIEAVISGDLAALKAALLAGASPNESDGVSCALSLSCIQERDDLVAELLRNGANVDLKEIDGSTPVFMAASIGNILILKALLEGGADTNVRNNIGQTSLMIAAHSGKVDCTKALLAHGADLKAIDNEGLGILHWAAIGGDWPDVTEVLLKAGADIYKKGLYGKTVIDYASSLNRTSMLRVLTA